MSPVELIDALKVQLYGVRFVIWSTSKVLLDVVALGASATGAASAAAAPTPASSVPHAPAPISLTARPRPGLRDSPSLLGCPFAVDQPGDPREEPPIPN